MSSKSEYGDRPWDRVEEPTITPEDGPTGGRKFSHPAYATISVNRTSGDASLFGSNIGQEGFISIKINGATMRRNGYSEAIFGGGPCYAEVYMTEAQWVSMISRMNYGSGTPCTLKMVRDGDMKFIPKLPNVEKAADRMQTQIDDLLASKIDDIEKHSEIVKALCEGLPAKKRNAIIEELGRLTRYLRSNHEFAHTILVEHKDKLVNDSKIEINAMANSLIREMGMQSVQQLGAMLSANPAVLMKALTSDGGTEPDQTE